jgi:hypothetical protein
MRIRFGGRTLCRERPNWKRHQSVRRLLDRPNGNEIITAVEAIVTAATDRAIIIPGHRDPVSKGGTLNPLRHAPRDRRTRR